MTPDHITHIVRQTFLIALQLATPFLLLSLIVGVVFSLIQSFLHMHEMTLTFVPKMLIVGVAIALTFPWILKILIKFTHQLLLQEWAHALYEHTATFISST